MKVAFTMIEFIFVIIILGTLVSLISSHMNRDLKQEASETILSHIRLAQRLALIDDRHRQDNNLWQRSYWRFEYGKCRNTSNEDGTSAYYYRVGSAKTLNIEFKKIESAINATDGKYLYTINTCKNLNEDESPTVLLSKRFGINRITNYEGCRGAQHIAFDHLGRPHHQIASYGSADFSKIMMKDCYIKFEMSSDESFTIKIESETGYASIL